MNDFRGTPIQVGSTVVYPVRHGARVKMREATVNLIRCSCGYFTARTGPSPAACLRPGSYLSLRVERDGKYLKLTNLTNVVVVR
jgi:hypothetical protein